MSEEGSREIEPSDTNSPMDDDSSDRAAVTEEETANPNNTPKTNGDELTNGDNDEKSKMAVDEDRNEAIAPQKPPSYDIQKSEIQPILSQKLKKGDEWYLIEQRWLKQWKKYTGFDSWDQYHAGSDTVIPGPVDNSNLFEKDNDECILKDHLMEELDYALLPKSAWERLVSWYSLTPGSRPICRRVVEYGTYVKHLKVEVYLFNLKVCIHPHINETKKKLFSRADTVGEVQDTLKQLFQVSKDVEVRLWQRYMTNSYELMKEVDQSLADSGIYGGQLLMLDTKNKDGKWSKESNSSSSYGGSSSYSSGTTASSGYSGTSSYSSSYYDRRQEPSTPGICGLSNLGNTCFMNSALQCLSNTQSLTEYFMGEKGVEKPYRKHINKDNPLGMKGALAETYGELLEMIWSGENSYLAPRQFKMMIGKHAPQFSGYQQHDSHELLAFLLDGLHEDLNLVRKKPYVDMDMKTEGRDDKDIAAETWHKYLLRNQSVIVRQFQGQLKSTLNCPTCKTTSRIFDPFMYLSLPLPVQKTRGIFVYLIRADPDTDLKKYRLTVPKNGITLQLKDAMQKVAGIEPKNLVVIDVYHSRFHKVYYDKDPVSQIMDRDDIYVYELSTPLGDQDWVPIPVYMREIRLQTSHSYFSKPTTTTYGQVFGLPIVVTVPREGCTYRHLYETILKQTRRYVTVPSCDRQIEKTDESIKESMDNKEDVFEDPPNTVAVGDKVEEMDVQSTREPEPTADENDNSPGDANEVTDTVEPMDTVIENGDTTKDNKYTSEEERENDENGDSGKSGKKVKEDNDDSNDKEESIVNGDLFKMIVVNSYGSQEVQRLEDNDKKLKLTSQTYVSCDWDIDTKDKYYDIKKTEEYYEDESCDEIQEKKKEMTIYDCMDLFAQEEQLGEEDAWYCPKCKDFVQASKKFDVWNLPDILVIHLKRFSYSRWWRNKIDTRVQFPLTGLDLSNYVVNEEHSRPVYDLYGVSNHFGGLGGGHYIAYCKNKITGKWYSFDDSHVSETDESSVCTSSSYLLFYARQTEGSRVRRGVDRSLSVSFDEEISQGTKRFDGKENTQSMDTSDKDRIDEDKEGEETDQANGDQQVQCTNDSATLSKCSTSQTGYYSDEFVSHFVTHCPRRAPLIHWGYWIRNQALEWIQNGFLDNYRDKYKQVLSLGAGFDTTYYKLLSSNKLQNTLYIEVDFPEVISRKKSILSRHASLSHDNNYKLIGCDITHLEKLEKSLLEEGSISKDTPTLIVAEVVLTYIKPQKVNSLLLWLSQFFTNALFCTYEQINPFDGFGQVMLSHFESISSPLLNIGTYPSQIAYQQRVQEHGWSDVISCDLNSFYYNLPISIRGPPLSLEPFDEFEEWHLKCGHYQLLCAFKGNTSTLTSIFSPPLRVERLMNGVIEKNTATWKCIWNKEQMWELQRFGHASVVLEDDSFLVHGGFGMTGPRLSQSRLKSLINIEMNSEMEWKVKELQTTGDNPGSFIHHTLTVLPSGDVLLIGGRGSPLKPNPHLYLLQRANWEWKKLQIITDGVQYVPRWRHTANLVDGGVVIIIGGHSKGQDVMADIWQLDTATWRMELLPVSLTNGRHSHVSVNIGNNELLVIGGLDSELYPHSTSMRLYKTSNNKWKIEEFTFTPPLPPRYSMTAHTINNDQLVLLGGVQLNTIYNDHSMAPAPIMIVNITKQTWRNVNIEYPMGMPLPLLHNHCSFVIQRSAVDTVLVMFGGGGNCFSFGTHFNNNPLTIRINNDQL